MNLNCNKQTEVQSRLYMDNMVQKSIVEYRTATDAVEYISVLLPQIQGSASAPFLGKTGKQERTGGYSDTSYP